jgi:hypothetical protein
MHCLRCDFAWMYLRFHTLCVQLLRFSADATPACVETACVKQ